MQEDGRKNGRKKDHTLEERKKIGRKIDGKRRRRKNGREICKMGGKGSYSGGKGGKKGKINKRGKNGRVKS